jgi:hypothetical protein
MFSALIALINPIILRMYITNCRAKGKKAKKDNLEYQGAMIMITPPF